MSIALNLSTTTSTLTTSSSSQKSWSCRRHTTVMPTGFYALAAHRSRYHQNSTSGWQTWSDRICHILKGDLCEATRGRPRGRFMRPLCQFWGVDLLMRLSLVARFFGGVYSRSHTLKKTRKLDKQAHFEILKISLLLSEL